MADVCGPWTLDQLDQFGTLDSLNFSLDDPVWTSAETCILEGAATVSATATTLSIGGFLLSAAADLSGVATVDAAGGLIFTVGGDVSADATVSGLGGILLSADAQVDGIATATGTGGLTISADGTLSGNASSIGSAAVTYISGGFVNAYAFQACSGVIFGEEWSDVPIESTVWTQTTEGSDQWQSQG